MSLVIFLAQNLAKINGKMCVVEPENVGDFLYDFKDSFENYNYYYKFEPYRETYIDNENIRMIKIFSISITRWVENCKIEESKLIDKYNLSFTKIKKYTNQIQNTYYY